MEDGKTCSLCHEWKPLDKFHKQPRGAMGRHSYCADCANAIKREDRKGKPRNPVARRRQLLRARYGITPEEFDIMMFAQNGKCAICGTPPDRPCVDHNHVTGEVRSILCHRCNIGLPYVEDIAFRHRAAAYLKSHERKVA